MPRKPLTGEDLAELTAGLNRLARNLWWTWDDEAQELFEVIDPEIWQKCDQNPSILFEQVKYNQLIELSQNKEYTDKLERVFKRFTDYLEQKPDKKGPRIAYFSMEFGLGEALPVDIMLYIVAASDARRDGQAVGF